MTGWIALIAVVWLGILPRVAQRPDVRDRRQHLDDRQIDPSAMFYTELAGIGRLLDELDDRNRRYPERLWIPAARRPSDRRVGPPDDRR